MSDEMGRCLWVSAIFCFGIPSIYLGTIRGKDPSELKKMVLITYPISFLLTIGITSIIQGTKPTKRAIGYLFSELVFTLWFTLAGIVILGATFFLIFYIFSHSPKEHYLRIVKFIKIWTGKSKDV
ncbi:hypothetical protein PG279_07480 [Riemerella anatipestifer]|nr:hypothetical protein [Riemerella anatipestifer]